MPMSASGAMLYTAFEQQARALWPLRAWARAAVPMLGNGHGTACAAPDGGGAARRCGWPRSRTAARRGTSRRSASTRWSKRPSLITPFATLTRFAKLGAPPQPRVLLVAPMSGHFATLLRDTVRTMLTDHDVYVTDWHSARDIPLRAGPFGLDEYTEHLMQFMRTMGPGSHLVAICQPCVAALAATALMSEDDDPAVPASLTLMAGPIDCRISPTAVNTLATSKSIEWFERNLISCVPLPLRGAGRRVYPGFVQVGAFMGMNRAAPHRRLSQLLHGAGRCRPRQPREPIRRFYEEYLAVSDLPAEFYLETVKLVFQDYALPRGELRLARPHDRPVGDPPHRAGHGRRRARRHLRAGPDAGGAGPVHEAAPLHAHAHRAGRRRPLRRVQRPASGSSTSTRCCAT